MPVDLDELGEVHVRAEGHLHRTGIRTQTVRRNLRPAGRAIPNVAPERRGRRDVARPDDPRDQQLRVGIQRRPRPRVSGFRRSFLGALHVRLLRVDEAPDLVHLDPLGPHAAHTASWYAMHARPASARSFLTVFSDTSSMPATARMEQPPRVSRLRIRIRWSVGRRRTVRMTQLF